ncbi:MAG: hypothetical protein QOH21_896 [Acidobacteriota bacterium]|jgi:hypothetical protein|nr:hypothetical protein [Acidobacteriota bacterium]
MPTMLRKLNFTERAKIPRSDVRVTLRRDDDGVLVFDPQLSFDTIDVVPTARVFIEAYYRTSFMRFDCGSVEAFAPPADRRLTEIDGTSVVRFRVKLVDNQANHHRIVAVADDIIVSEEKRDSSGRIPLLPVNFTDSLGQQAWRIAFEPNGPVLELNNRIEAIKDVAKNDAAFFALVYPAAVRQVLAQILLVEQQDARQEGDEWWNLWLRWAASYATPLPADPDEAAFWIDDVVAAFCDGLKLIDRWRSTRTEGA